MKILVLSDLHLHFWNNESAMTHYKQIVSKYFKDLNFDCIVISGDIFESDIMNSKKNPYQILRNIFSFTDKPIITCLGNHEFAYQFVNLVLKYFNSFQDKFNIHCLDIEHSFKLNNYNFIGNVFWYDNTLANNQYSRPDWIIPSWLDSTIKNFIPSRECATCKKQILNNIDHNAKNILVTHTVPHYKMNWFSINQPTSYYNQYSGCYDFLKELKDVVLSISGHTHKKMDEIIYGIKCVNVGNDYLSEDDKIEYQIINI